MQLNAFLDQGKCVLLAADAAAPTGVQVVGATTQMIPNTVYVANTSNQWVHLAYAGTAALAQSAAVIPTGGTSQSVTPLAPNSVTILTVAPTISADGVSGLFFSGITPAAGPANVFIRPGEGI